MTVKTGFAAIIGKPNVGKSTLLNQILGQKISITSKKAQTTFKQLIGIKTDAHTQTIYVDTPGLNLVRRRVVKRAFNRALNRAAQQAIVDVDVIVWIVDLFSWQEEEEWILEQIKTLKKPVILAVNKIDKAKNDGELLARLAFLGEKRTFAAIIPISAKTGKQVGLLEQKISELLPEMAHYWYPEDQVTDAQNEFLITEYIREKVVRLLGQELPYTTRVSLEKYELIDNTWHVYAILWAENEGHKPIIIGKNGERLKKIGMQAREDIETLLEKKVFLKLWVKILPRNKKHLLELTGI